jgi:hypothetical protein
VIPIFIALSKYQAQTTKFNSEKVEAGDPRYRLPLSQLDSPSERGASEGGSIFLVLIFSNDSCNADTTFV